MKNRETLRARKAFCLELAEQIEAHFGLRRTPYDVDQAAGLIDSLLPNSRDEDIAIAAEIDEEIAEVAVPRGPGLAERLREALGLNEKVSLKETLEAAIERAGTAKRLEAAFVKLRSYLLSHMEWYPNEDGKEHFVHALMVSYLKVIGCALDGKGVADA